MSDKTDALANSPDSGTSDSGGTSPGPIFIELLSPESQDWPTEERIVHVLRSHLGELNIVQHSEQGITAAMLEWAVDVGAGADQTTADQATADQAEDGGSAAQEPKKLPPMLQIIPSHPFDASAIAQPIRDQMWDVFPHQNELLDSLKYQVLGGDVLGTVLHPRDRAAFTMLYLDALLELFPATEAVLFADTGRLMRVADLREHGEAAENAERTEHVRDQAWRRYVRLAANVRVFRMDGDEWLIDTFGLHKLGAPDVQYHFRGLDLTKVAAHALTVAEYQLEHDFPIRSGNSIAGIEESDYSDEAGQTKDPATMWRCNYEKSLMVPDRVVLDIHTGPNAVGEREA
ncbi:DUF4261 domain-containing protein [Trueperella bialowiezensis]|uniref:DUF4261 domain-containing protein n=1 Tax=Trueperella bialowiezensis TaxID=312285 RepID=A0A3S4X673_9ACTO|nr:DUF4261 domain-containing protein [Trueperella bialowiezensis]VEI13513.1 Uncharacterised protein [Trueperella bialowiezensis]